MLLPTYLSKLLRGNFCCCCCCRASSTLKAKNVAESFEKCSPSGRCLCVLEEAERSLRSGYSLVRTGIGARHYTAIGIALHVFTYLQLLYLYVHSGKLVLHVALGSGACNDTVSCIHLWLSNSLTVQGYPCSNCTRVCKLMCSSILLAIRYLNYVL